MDSTSKITYQNPQPCLAVILRYFQELCCVTLERVRASILGTYRSRDGGTVFTFIKSMADARSFGCNTAREPCLEEWAGSGHVEMGTGLALQKKSYKTVSVP